MFNYFLPGATKEQVAKGDKLDHDVLRNFGLGDALSDVHRVPEHATVIDQKIGPAGGPGAVIAPVNPYKGPPDCFCDPLYQVWEACRGGRYWIGYSKRHDPKRVPFQAITPQDIERFDALGGVPVADHGGREWAIPVCRAPNFGFEFGTLPQSYTLDPESGETQSHLQTDFAWLWDLAGQIRDWYIADLGPTEDATPAEKAAFKKPEFSKLVGFAARLLGVNYRISPVELNVLHKLGVQLLTRDSVHPICRAAYGWEVLELAKKKPPEGTTDPAASFSPSTTGDATPPAAPGIDLAAPR
jgi:hypothetical protein